MCRGVLREIHLIRRRSYQSELGLERTVFVALLAESPEVVRSLKLGNVWVFVQLIHRPRRTESQLYKNQNIAKPETSLYPCRSHRCCDCEEKFHVEVLLNCKYKRVSIHIRRFCQEESSLRRVLVLKEGRLSQSPWEDTKDSENSLSVWLGSAVAMDVNRG